MAVVLWGAMGLLWVGILASPFAIAGALWGNGYQGISPRREMIGWRMCQVALVGMLGFTGLAVVWLIMGLMMLGVVKLL